MQKKGIVIDIDNKIHTRLKLLSIAKGIPIYKIVEEFMKLGLEHEREVLEKESKKK